MTKETHIRIPLTVKARLDAIKLDDERFGSLINRLIDFYEGKEVVNKPVNVPVNEDVYLLIAELSKRVSCLESEREASNTPIVQEPTLEEVIPKVIPEVEEVIPTVETTTPGDAPIVEKPIPITSEMREEMIQCIKAFVSSGHNQKEAAQKIGMPIGSFNKIGNEKHPLINIKPSDYEKILGLS